MSAEQTRRDINQIDKELASQQKKMADCAKSEAEKKKKINEITRSINNNTSLSTRNSKYSQIQSLNTEIGRLADQKASISKKISDLTEKRGRLSEKLYREEADENKKRDETHKKETDALQRRISELTGQRTFTFPIRMKEHKFVIAQKQCEYDVFISHASEDKEDYVDKLYKILTEKYHIKVWYDTQNITWGSSIREKIDDGLKKSRFGIVVISRYFIEKYWTQYEFDGLFQKETTNGKTVLPIWHNITRDEVMEFSPTLAGKMALNTAIHSIDEIATMLKDLLDDKNV